MFDVMIFEIKEIDMTETDSVELKHASEIMSFYTSSHDALKTNLDERLARVSKQVEEATKYCTDLKFDNMDNNGTDNSQEINEAFRYFVQLSNEKKAIEQTKVETKKMDQTIKAVNDASDLKTFLKSSMGKCEQLIERLITKSPINCKHNTYYSGSFNGNNCLRLVQNMDFVMNKLQEKLDQDGNKSTLCERYGQIWSFWKSILPTLRAARRLSDEEIEQLYKDIDVFCVA